MKNINKPRTKILLFENSALDFFSARLDYALYLKSNGFDVTALCPHDNIYSERIKSYDINLIEYEYERKNRGVFYFLKLLFQIRFLIAGINFDIIHSFRFFPNLLSSILFCNKDSRLILHVTGLGISFSRNSLKFSFFRIISQGIYLFKFIVSDKIIFQNNDDKHSLFFSKFFRRKIEIVLGSGVDITKFDSSNFNKNELRVNLGLNFDDIVFICISRLIIEKGITELVDAFIELNKNNKLIKLFIVGTPDNENPRSISDRFVRLHSNKNGITFLGYQKEVAKMLMFSDYFILPSYYREGIPRSILEAMSMSLPILTTNMPGCRETVIAEYNGVLFNPRSSDEIVNSVLKILSLPKYELGHNSRMFAKNTFSQDIVFGKLLNIYS